MRHLTRLVLTLSTLLVLQGCQLALPGSGKTSDTDVTPNAVAGDAIEVVALDPPPPDPTAAPPPVPPSTAAAQDGLPTVAAEAPPVPAPIPGAVSDTEAAEPAAEVEPEPAPAAPKSAAQLACEKKRGQWTPTGKGDLRTCVFVTRDGGKSCTRESQCEGACLARSGTCSPIRPLLGCQEILQDNGARVTQCID